MKCLYKIEQKGSCLKWEAYITGIMTLLMLIFSYPYMDAELKTSNFTNTTLGLATGMIVPLIMIISIVIMAILMLVMVVKDLSKG